MTRSTARKETEGKNSEGPRPIVVFLILVCAIVVLGAVFAAARVFLFPDGIGGRICVAQGPLPDQICSPGDIFPDATADIICQKGYSASVRNVSQDLKDQVYAEYGIKTHKAYEYEVDHIISLELGGSNDIKNLYPEAAVPVPGYHEKDSYENYLHKQVCIGNITLREAQRMIATDWYSYWMAAGQP